MKIKAVHLLRCLLLLVVSGFVLLVAMPALGHEQATNDEPAQKQTGNKVWNKLVSLVDWEHNDDKESEEQVSDESENFDYTYEHKAIELPPYWVKSPLTVFQCSNLSMLSQAEPDYQPRPPRA